MKDFDAWNELKQQLDMRVNGSFFKEREVWFAAVGLNVGHEEDGKHDNFERPVLVVKRFNRHLFLGTAFSSILKPENNFYHIVQLKNKDASIILSQTKVYSSKRLLRRIAILDEENFLQTRARIMETMFTRDKKTNPAIAGSSGPEGIYKGIIAKDGDMVKPDVSTGGEKKELAA